MLVLVTSCNAAHVLYFRAKHSDGTLGQKIWMALNVDQLLLSNLGAYSCKKVYFPLF